MILKAAHVNGFHNPFNQKDPDEWLLFLRDWLKNRAGAQYVYTLILTNILY